VSPSLQAISEAEEPSTEEIENVASPVVFSNPDMQPRPSSTQPRSEDEDEGVSLKDSISPKTAESVVERVLTPNGAPSPEEIQPVSQSTPPTDVSANTTPAEANGVSIGDRSNTSKVADEAQAQIRGGGEGTDTSGPASVGQKATDDEISASVHTTALDAANDTTHLKKRGPPTAEVEPEIPRITSPMSSRPMGVEPRKGENWIHAFLRLLFVDIIGGFISRLCGGKKRTTT
jgi:hypothetical protein